MAKKKSIFVRTTITAGLILMGLSFLVFNYANSGFLGEVHSELFGVGAGFLTAGIAGKIFGVRF